MNDKYKGICLGSFNSTKENFCFSLPTGELFVRQSEYSIHKVVKELNLKSIVLHRDRDYWTTGKRQMLTQSAEYTPKY